MSKKYEVSAVCNALMDIVIKVRDEDIKSLELNKGAMTLVDSAAQGKILEMFDGQSQTVELGGSAMNAIRALAMLGLPTSFTGMVGKDSFGSKIKERMSSLGIDDNLSISPEATGTCLILVTPDGERTMVTCLGASRLYDASTIPEKEISESKIFHFCGYQWDTDDQKSAIRKAISTAKENDCLVSFDVADPFVVTHNREAFENLISEDADIVFANEDEAKLLYNTTPEETAIKIAATGAIAVVKLGAKGAIIRRGDEQVRIDAVKTTVVDTTAAGDMFAGGFLYGISKGVSLSEAGRYGATLASDVISRFGGTLSPEIIASIKT